MLSLFLFKHFTSQREEFEGTRESMLVWLTELDLQLTNVEHFSESDVHHKIQQLNVRPTLTSALSLSRSVKALVPVCLMEAETTPLIDQGTDLKYEPGV